MTRTCSTLLAALLVIAATTAQSAPSNAAEGATGLRLSMPDGAPPAVGRPLLHDGIVVVAETPASISALDAATGEPLWRFEDEAAGAEPGNALLAFSDGLLILATPDARLITLDLHSGRLRWQVEAADASQGYRYDAPPLAIDGRVIAPIAGCEPNSPSGCWIAAYDAESGSELWRRTLDPGSGQTAASARVAGGSAKAAVSWISPIYEPDTTSLFVGLTVPDSSGAAHPLVTFALDAESGAVQWFRQESPPDKVVLDTAWAE